MAGVVGQWNLRVEPDSPPSVSWQRPGDDLYVLPKAVVPIEIVVKDDLAIQRVDLTYDRNDKSESERAARPKEPPIALYRGPEKPAIHPARRWRHARREPRRRIFLGFGAAATAGRSGADGRRRKPATTAPESAARSARDGFRLSTPKSLRPGWPIGNCKSPASSNGHSRSNARRAKTCIEWKFNCTMRADLPNAIAYACKRPSRIRRALPECWSIRPKACRRWSTRS